MRLPGPTSGITSGGHNSEGVDDVIVDTTGAGDAYIGGFLYGVLHSMTLAVRIYIYVYTHSYYTTEYICIFTYVCNVCVVYTYCVMATDLHVETSCVVIAYYTIKLHYRLYTVHT